MELKRRIALFWVTIWLIQLDFAYCKKKPKREAKISERPWGPDYIKIVGKASDQGKDQTKLPSAFTGSAIVKTFNFQMLKMSTSNCFLPKSPQGRRI